MTFLSLLVMKAKHAQAKLPSMHIYWQSIRGPFRKLYCTDHKWEQYDVQHAGCLLCGYMHECSPSMCENKCPLVTLEDGGVCCTITGFCASVVRYSDKEFMPTVCYSHLGSEEKKGGQVNYEEVLNYVRWFLMGSTSVKCKADEIQKNLARIQGTVIKLFKQHKLDQAGHEKHTLPCLCTVLSGAVHANKPKFVESATEELCGFCAYHIAKCIRSLNLANFQNRKLNLVIGMLYLMKQGLVMRNVQWLPRASGLQHCLPHETSLEKTFKLSMKLVCETENEIKLALRHQIKML
jgi:hypothetical protein